MGTDNNQPEIYLFLGRLEGKMDQVIQGQADMHQRVDKLSEKQEKDKSAINERVSKLERRESFVLGIASVLSLGLSIATSLIVKWFSGGH